MNTLDFKLHLQYNLMQYARAYEGVAKLQNTLQLRGIIRHHVSKFDSFSSVNS